MKQDSSNKPVTIGRLLSGVFKEKKWRSRLELHRVFEFWHQVVGSDIAAIAQPSLIRSGVLWVKVKDSVWMQQLHLQKVLLLEKINAQLTGEKLTDIHLQLDSSLAVEPKPKLSGSGEQPVLLDKKKELEFDRMISSLENEDLKNSLKNLWIRMQVSSTKRNDK